MYKLTDIMLQSLEKDLRKFHELFQGGRCQAWQLEELIAKAIRSDFSKSEGVIWKGNGHDIGCDIIINNKHHIQIKSGKIEGDFLKLSGHRLGRFNSDLEQISDFLNKNDYVLISVPYYLEKGDFGKKHVYQIFYIDTNILKIDDHTSWQKIKKNYFLTNKKGVQLSLHPSMSWQIWWKIPLSILEKNNNTRLITID